MVIQAARCLEPPIYVALCIGFQAAVSRDFPDCGATAL